MPRAKKSSAISMRSKLQSRKLLVGFIVLASGVSIDLTVPRGLSDNLLTLLIAILGIYVTGNVSSKVANNMAPKKTKEKSGDIEKELDEVRQAQVQSDTYLNELLTSVQSLQQQVTGIINRIQPPGQ